MAKNKKEWDLEKHKKRSPQLNKTVEHQDKQFSISTRLSIILCIFSLIFGGLIASYFHIGASKDSRNKYDSLSIEHNKTQEEVMQLREELYPINRELFQKVDQILVQQNETNNERTERLIYKETGYTFDEIKQKAEQFKEIAKSYYDIGLANSILGNYEEAIKNYDKAIENNPNFADAWLSKGNALGKLGIYEEAVEAFDNAIEINPQYAGA